MAEFKLMKVFDANDLPDFDLQTSFACYASEHWGAGNDSYIRWKVAAHTHETFGLTPAEVKAINAWLLANGAEVNETVLLHHWW